MASVYAFILVDFNPDNGLQIYYLYSSVMIIYIGFIFGCIGNLIYMHVWQRHQSNPDTSRTNRNRGMENEDLELNQYTNVPRGRPTSAGHNERNMDTPTAQPSNTTTQLQNAFAPPTTPNLPTRHVSALHHSNYYTPNMLWVTLMVALCVRTLWNANKLLLVDIVMQGIFHHS